MNAVAAQADTRPTTRIADPGPLGLTAFALTTLLLSLANAGILPEAGAIAVSMALFCGGLAQFVAGMWEFARGNTFGATAFTAYGAFWLSYWWLQVTPAVADEAGARGFGTYLLCWAVLTALMTIASAKTNGATLVVFTLLTVTLLCLALGDLTGAEVVTRIGGWFGLATGVGALYTAWAGVTNATWNRPVLPVWPRS
jgi:succinate-acetate transporter protein